MPESTLTIDCQVHAYEKDSLSRPWQGFLQGPDEVTGDDMVAAMGSVIRPAWTMKPARMKFASRQMAVRTIRFLFKSGRPPGAKVSSYQQL